MKIEYLHQDDYFIAINKPSGLLSVPGRGPENQDCAISQVQQLYPDSRIIHRLDMATSGILLIAKNVESLRAFSKLFEERRISKRYIAVVDGIIAEDSGSVELPLICDWPYRPKQKVCFETGKSAHTTFKIISRDQNKGNTRIELTPITGRSHQLRVHMLKLGHPILGANSTGQNARQPLPSAFYCTQHDCSSYTLSHLKKSISNTSQTSKTNSIPELQLQLSQHQSYIFLDSCQFLTRIDDSIALR